MIFLIILIVSKLYNLSENKRNMKCIKFKFINTEYKHIAFIESCIIIYFNVYSA